MEALRPLLSALLLQPGVLAGAVLAALLTALLATALLSSLLAGGSGAGNGTSASQLLFSLFVRSGRLRNLLCSSCDRCSKRYPLANTCQVPFFASLSDVYSFVFGYKCEGLFVEVGAYDGESFSNTSGLADMGWRGHYLEPIPRYAEAARARHASNAPRVQVHTLCAGEKDGESVELSTAGPFSSAVPDEIAAVEGSAMKGVLEALGWGHASGAPKITATTKALNSFWKEQGLGRGEVDVLVSGAALGPGGGRSAPAPFSGSHCLSLSLSLSLTHTHTHCFSLSLPLSLSFCLCRWWTLRALSGPYSRTLTWPPGRPSWSL
jgi:hypothetical protein